MEVLPLSASKAMFRVGTYSHISHTVLIWVVFIMLLQLLTEKPEDMMSCIQYKFGCVPILKT